MALSGTSSGRKNVAVAFAIAAIVIAAYVVYSSSARGLPSDPNISMYVDSETGKAFPHKNAIGEDLPIYSPVSGKNTGYPGEACYWTADGATKTKPTWVILNDYLDKPGPTFCPDCGRLVVSHNPEPSPESQPPPTQEQWRASRLNTR